MKFNINDRVGRWSIIGPLLPGSKNIKSQKPPRYLCLCDCGTKREVPTGTLLSGKSLSCGCRRSETTTQAKTIHGCSKNGSTTRLYETWTSMKSRCLTPTNHAWKHYGGRGITLDPIWKDSFIEFKLWADSSGYEESLTLDRIDVNGNYEPNNCRWATMKEQNNNRRDNHLITAWGETKTLVQWKEDSRCNITTLGIIYRIEELDWTPEKAISEPRDRPKLFITAWGETKSAMEWEIDPRCNVNKRTIYRRITKLGITPEEAISIPPYGSI